jgi:hypothetical protein
MCYQVGRGGARGLKVPERYLFSLTITYALTTFLVSFFINSTLDLYVSLYIVEYFVLTLLHSPLKAKSQKITNWIGYVLFVVFILIVSLKVLQILGMSVL